jgi:phosphatidylserine decarboxylase
MRLAQGAWRYVAPAVALTAAAVVLSAYAGVLLLAVTCFVVYFFRDPERTPPSEGILSPADGRVSVVREERHEDGDRVRVGVFLGPTNVHVVRAPMAGAVETVTHRPGAHRPAFSKESERNERVDIAAGEFEVSLIAGWFARRITPYVAGGENLSRGERVGHIAFGSRVDVLLPPTVERGNLAVSEGESVRAGETVLVD